ncbi:MAG: hypothetical protein V3T73_03535 [Dehalococcoidales bacterium]
MKRIVFVTLTLVMALGMTIPLAGAAMAQPAVSADTETAVRPALAVKAPEVARVGQPITIKVVDRHSGRPVPKAGVWAINVRDITSEVNDAEAYASLAENRGHFLGWTDRKGNISHRFSQPGGYILVAAKAGFTPGFAKITVKPHIRKALAVISPQAARVGQPVTIQVVEKHISKPIAGAAVFAIDVKDLANETGDAESYAELARDNGFFIGLTNRNGEVRHRFREAGRYILVAVKDGFVPGLARITIMPLWPISVEPTLVPEQTGI